MNTEEFNSLLNFVDGRLTPGQERRLLFKAAKDDILRQNLKQFISLDNSGYASAAEIVPSPASTGNLFSNLGYNYPYVTPSGVISKLASQTAATVTRFGAMIIGVVCSSILTSLVLLLFINHGKPISQISENNIKVHNKTVSIKPGQTSAKILSYDRDRITSTFTGKKESAGNKSDSKITEVKNKFMDNPDEYQSTALVRIEPSQISDASINIRPAYNFKQDTVPLLNNTDIKTKYETAQEKLAQRKSGLDLVYKSGAFFTLPAATISPESVPPFLNNELSVFYSFNKTFQTGISVRQETFFLKYKGIEEGYREFEYQQQPAFTTFCLAGVYNVEWSERLRQRNILSLGGNKNGGVVRLSAGMEYLLYDNIAILFDIEYSHLAFLYQGKMFHAPKIGACYGFSVKF